MRRNVGLRYRYFVAAAAALVLVAAATAATLFAASAPATDPPAEQRPQAGQSPAETPPPAAEDGLVGYTSVQPLPDGITLATLANGLTAIVQENRVAPVATVRCYVKNTGSAFEGRYLGAGLSHVLEHVVAGGTTTRYTEKQIEKIIDGFGGARNAFTTDDMTGYFINCPAKDTATAVGLMADAMQHVTFEPAEFERELKVVRRELADGEVDRPRVLWKLLNETVYKVSPARIPVIGYPGVLDRTTNEAIVDFYHRRYVPDNQVVVVVGDVDTRAVLEQIARQWGDAPRGYTAAAAFPQEPAQLAPREAIREMDGTTYDLVFAWPTIELSDDDLYALDLAAYILAEGESSRMVRRLKYDEGLVLSVRSASYTPHWVRGFFAVLASATPERWQPASRAILDEVYRLRDELVGPAELAKAKKQKAAELVFGRQTVEDAAESLGRSYLSTADPLFDRKYVENIQKVTAEQVREVARRYFLPERLNKVIVAPPGGAPGPTTEAAAAAESETRLVRLPNGLRVLLRRAGNLPLVNIQAYVLGGCLVDQPQTAGRSALVGDMLDKGTAGHTAEQIAEYFDSIGGQMSMGSGRFTVFGGATVLKEDFPQAAALFAECFTRPTFPADQFEKIRALALGAIARRAGDPQAEALEVFDDALPASSPFHVIQGGTEESVRGLSVDDLKAYHARYFVPGNMVVTVFGDVDPDAALEIVRQQFGGLKPAPDFKPVSFDRSNALAEDVVRHKQTRKQTGMVLLGYPDASILQQEDYAAMTVLDAMTSGYSYPGGWLHNELRGEGLVYYVHAFQLTGPAPGYFTVMAQTRPDAIDEVVERIRRNLERARAGQISDDEFRTAVDMIVSLHAQESTTAGEQARQAALDELYGLGYDYDKSFDERIRSVTRDQVVAAARKYLGGHYVLVTASPEERPKK